MSEDIVRAGTFLDVSKMFPEAARRVEVLDKMKRSWPSIVGMPTARYSQPYNLGVNELWVCVNNPNARNALMKSKGSIVRRIARQLDYDLGKDFVLTLTEKIPQPKRTIGHDKVYREVFVDEEKVRQCMKDAPETLPEDINYAISHLQVTLEQINPQRRT